MKNCVLLFSPVGGRGEGDRGGQGVGTWEKGGGEGEKGKVGREAGLSYGRKCEK